MQPASASRRVVTSWVLLLHSTIPPLRGPVVDPNRSIQARRYARTHRRMPPIRDIFHGVISAVLRRVQTDRSRRFAMRGGRAGRRPIDMNGSSDDARPLVRSETLIPKRQEDGSRTDTREVRGRKGGRGCTEQQRQKETQGAGPDREGEAASSARLRVVPDSLHDAGDHVPARFDVMSQQPSSSRWSEARRRRPPTTRWTSTGLPRGLGARQRLVRVREEGSQSRDKFMSSGQNIAVKGTTVGYYLFRRSRRTGARSEPVGADGGAEHVSSWRRWSLDSRDRTRLLLARFRFPPPRDFPGERIG